MHCFKLSQKTLKPQLNVPKWKWGDLVAKERRNKRLKKYFVLALEHTDDNATILTPEIMRKIDV